MLIASGFREQRCVFSRLFVARNLDLDSRGHDVELLTWPKPEIQVEVNQRTFRWTGEIREDAVPVSIDQQEDLVRVRAPRQWLIVMIGKSPSIALRVTVPGGANFRVYVADANVRASGMGGSGILEVRRGSIHVDDVDGRVMVAGRFRHIAVNEAHGKIEAHVKWGVARVEIRAKAT